jgi:hypothetical protein
MASTAERAQSFARQSEADYATWQSLEKMSEVPECHRMLFLQMTCEKLCKASLLDQGKSWEQVQKSHAFIAKPLPLVIRFQLEYEGHEITKHRDFLTYVRQVAQEIELSNPAVRRDGKRPDNSEYPWEDENQSLHSPLDWSFIPLQMLRDNPHFGTTFVKLLKRSIERLLDNT